MSAVVADTHAIVWMLQADPRLSAVARQALDNAVATSGRIYVSAISLVELVYLVERQRVPCQAWDRLLGVTREHGSYLAVIPIDAELAAAVEQVPAADIPDMPDRIIAATALLLDVPLVTRDRRIAASTIKTIW